MVHQELARRIRVLVAKRGSKGLKGYLKLLKMGYQEMREEAMKFEGKETEAIWQDCPGCRVRPAFLGEGDTNIRRTGLIL